MFLLRRVYVIQADNDVPDLHSNMFLLRRASESAYNDGFRFTFQYVSIKTEEMSMIDKIYYNLHSNMFLLRLETLDVPLPFAIFTFQYVSIKTRTCNPETKGITNLHSNMFLLRLLFCQCQTALTLIYIPICFY